MSAVCAFVAVAHLAIAQLVVITHGGLLKKVPDWVPTLAQSIASTNGSSMNSATARKAVVGLDGKESKDGPRNFILFDWTDKSSVAGSADTTIVGGVLATTIIKRISDLHKQSKEKIDLHVIGHSRGCFVNCAALRLVGENQNLRHVKLTHIDPFPGGTDGELEANLSGVVDWTENYYQTLSFPHGKPIEGALNVNISGAIGSAWKSNHFGGHHSQANEWLVNSLNQRKIHPNLMTRLYGGFLSSKDEEAGLSPGPLMETLDGGRPLYMDLRGGKGDNLNRLPLQPGKVNTLVPGAIHLTEADNWLAAMSVLRFAVERSFTLQFSFIIDKHYLHKDKRFKEPVPVPADGIAVYMVDWNGLITGNAGGELGFTNSQGQIMDGVAVLFDTYYNEEYKDYGETTVPGRTISLRSRKDRAWEDKIFPGALPEPVTSGNQFLVRLTLDKEEKVIGILVYSFGQDKLFATSQRWPDGMPMPKVMKLAIGGITGAAFSRQRLIGQVILVQQ